VSALRAPRPACIDAVGVDKAWRSALPDDLDKLDPCGFCFPDAESVAEIDKELEDLVASSCGDRLHRHEDTGDVDFGATGERSDLRNRILNGDISAEDLGLDTSVPEPGSGERV
jgi:hypothetical protein